jgi:hypothetical protein
MERSVEELWGPNSYQPTVAAGEKGTESEGEKQGRRNKERERRSTRGRRGLDLSAIHSHS